MRAPLLAAALTAALGVLAVPVLAVPAGPACAAPGSPSVSPRPAPRATELARLADPRIVEGSGLATSARHPGVVYVENDSGDTARVFAVGLDGRTRATFTVHGATNVDWESLASGPHATLWVGDTGDNTRSRDEVAVYRMPEPSALGDGSLTARRFRLRYPDGPHDAEALLVQPRTGRVYVATKGLLDPGLYAAPRHLSADAVNTMTRLRGVPLFVTGGEFAPDGRRLVLRDLAVAHLYAVDGEGAGLQLRSLRDVRLPDQRQGESVTWTRDGHALVVGSEGARSRVWRVRVDAPTASPSPTRAGGASGGSSGPSAGPSSGSGTGLSRGASTLLTVGAVLSVLTALALAARRRRGPG